MFGSVFDKATGFLDKRFVLNLLLPVLAFWGGLVLVAAQGSAWAGWVEWWAGHSGLEQVLLVGAAIAGLFLFAFIFSGQVVTLTRLWEGYWPGGRGTRLASWRIARHRRRWDGLDLDQDVDYMRRFYGFPVNKDDVRPTRLGNALRAAEDYPGDDERYGMDAVFFWPRLYLVLPSDTRTIVDDYRSGLDRMVLLASLALAFPPVALVVRAAADASWLVWVIASAAALVIAAIAYHAAVSAAIAFGDVVRACFDLHRRTLMTQFGLVLPPSLEAERTRWAALMQQLYQRGNDDPSQLVWRLEDDTASRPEPPNSDDADGPG
ncbi:MAG TPA: hypothetical protein VH969_03475 [Actinophytocola sp.]|jgi:hypothetical protein|uniref:hypothetical protein n=1 Tax=Actinophytocola sp. TaxID=1872138 RepID=UPI002F93EBC0